MMGAAGWVACAVAVAGVGWPLADRSAPWWALMVGAAGFAALAAQSGNVLGALGASLLVVACVVLGLRLRAKQAP